MSLYLCHLVKNYFIKDKNFIYCHRNLRSRIYFNKAFSSNSRAARTLIYQHIFPSSPHHVYCVNIFRWRSRSAFSHKDVIPVLQQCNSVQEQLEKLYETLRLTSEDCESRINICRKTENALKPFYPECVLQLVGSSVNGFGIKGCDMDMMLQTGHAAKLKVAQSRPPLMKAVLDGTYPLEKLYRLSIKHQLTFMKDVLKESCPEFENFEYITGRCPIIKFYASDYGVKCDLAMNNELAVHGSKLLHFYGELDKRVGLLIVFLVYWARRASLVGGYTRFKTYALYLMVLFFLETRNPPVIPNIGDLISRSDFFTSGKPWDYKTSPGIDKIEPSKNTQSAEELLREFFFFYAYFDFNNGICPKSGTSVDQRLLASSDKLQVNYICVEDPFDCKFNCTQGLLAKNAQLFSKHLLRACRLYQDETVWSPSSNDWGLMQLLSREDEQELSNSNGCFSFQIPIAREYRYDMEKKLNGVLDGNIPLKEVWLQMVFQTVKYVLEYGFLLNCSVLEKGGNYMYRDVDGISESLNLLRSDGTYSQIESVPFIVNHLQNTPTCQKDNTTVLHLHCTVHDTFLGREECRRQLYSSDFNSKSVLEKEHEMSLIIYQQKQDQICNKAEFEFLCSEGENSDLSALQVTIKSLGKASPQKLGIFLKEHLPDIVKSVI